MDRAVIEINSVCFIRLSGYKTIASELLLSSFDVDTMPMAAFLFQTGYLSIRGSRQLGARRQYTLGYLNPEVWSSLNEVLLKTLMANPSEAEKGPNG